jgi:phage baseplate assembly protein gpV
MKKIFYLLIFLANTVLLNAQNVGIGVPVPTEKLDVKGNINLTGTIKANGADGAAGQVLMKNSSGNLAWGDFNNYKHVIGFQASTFTQPSTIYN